MTSIFSDGDRTITVAVVDDNRLVREALATMLSAVPDLTVVAAAVADPAFIEQTRPDVVLLDVGLADDDSLSVATALVKRCPSVRIIVMDLLPMSDDTMAFVNAGVCGFMLKDATFDEFVATIRSVAAGDKVLPARMTQSLFSQIAKVVETAEPARIIDDVRMTRREREVIELIGEGLSNKEIAQRLNIASHTVKSHVRNVMDKLALHTRLQIAAYLRRDGA
ncbi:MAG TPA: response regulator transcription factor [Gemmatimonadaceae bacterium]|nr:response regulator transcription factor [Gemmatimonadaceae bacterium]